MRKTFLRQFLRWTALKSGSEYQWGDGGEHQKREELAQQTISGFATAKRAPDPTELEDFLDNGMRVTTVHTRSPF